MYGVWAWWEPVRHVAASVASSGHVPVPDDTGGGGSLGGVRGAQGEAGAGSVGGRSVAVHGDMRGVDPGLAATGEHCGGGGDDGDEVDGVMSRGDESGCRAGLEAAAGTAQAAGRGSATAQG